MNDRREWSCNRNRSLLSLVNQRDTFHQTPVISFSLFIYLSSLFVPFFKGEINKEERERDNRQKGVSLVYLCLLKSRLSITRHKELPGVRHSLGLSFIGYKTKRMPARSLCSTCDWRDLETRSLALTEGKIKQGNNFLLTDQCTLFLSLSLKGPKGQGIKKEKGRTLIR